IHHLDHDPRLLLQYLRHTGGVLADTASDRALPDDYLLHLMRSFWGEANRVYSQKGFHGSLRQQSRLARNPGAALALTGPPSPVPQPRGFWRRLRRRRRNCLPAFRAAGTLNPSFRSDLSSTGAHPMSSTGSVTNWITLLRAGNHDAAQELWQRYHRRLLALARKRLHGARLRAADESDVVQSVFDSFFRATEQ